MEEGKASMGIGKNYDYVEKAAQAIVDRQRYFRQFLKNNLSEVKRK